MKKTFIRRISCLILAFTLVAPIFSGCAKEYTVNYYLGDKLLYSEQVKGSETFTPTYEFNEELLEFESWVDENGNPIDTIALEGDLNLYAKAKPVMEVWCSNLNGVKAFNIGDTIFVEVKVPKLDGWYLTYEASHQKEVEVSLRSSGRGFDLHFVARGCVYRFKAVYTNGIEEVKSEEMLFYFEHWNNHLGFYFMPGEPTNYDTESFYANTNFYTVYTVPLNGQVNFENIRVQYGPNLIYYEPVIDSVVIEDESIVTYDKEEMALKGLKAGTTKVTVYGKWFDITWDTWTNMREGESTPHKGTGSANLKREMTITVA